VIRSHGWCELAPFNSQEPYDRLEYVLELDGGSVVAISLQEAPGGISVTLDGSLTAEEQSELADKVAWMLGLDMDFTWFYEHAKDEPKLASAARQARGRILRSATVFEDVVRTILTTNTTWSGTKRMVKALVELYGRAVEGNAEKIAFPTALHLAKADVETLRKDGKLGYRAPYVLELAQRSSSEELDLEALKENSLPVDEVRRRLLALKGVGPYAAANLLMLLGHYGAIPVDSWALKMVSQEFYSGVPVGRKEVESSFERWGEWQGLAFWLWDWS